MLASEKIRKIYNFMGYVGNGKFRKIPLVMNTLCLILCIDTLSFILLNNEAEDETGSHVILFMAAKDINVLLSIFGYSIEYLFFDKNINNLIKVIDKEFNKFKISTNEQLFLTHRLKTNQNQLLNRTGFLLCIIVFTLIFLPSFVALYIIYDRGVENVDVIDLPLPIVFWYPENYDVIEVYILAYTLHAIYLIYLLGHIYCVYGSVISSIQSILIDIELFCIDIKGIELLKFNREKNYFKALRDYTNYLVKCHQDICGNVKLLNQCVSLVITIGNQCICFQICIFLYCIAEIDNIFAKFGYFSIALSEASVLLIYCYNGQKIINGNDEIRRCLSQCTWLDQPKWFKRDLLIMMAMADRPLHIQPFGLYVLTLRNFTNIMNAAYSYFNMLRTLHK